MWVFDMKTWWHGVQAKKPKNDKSKGWEGNDITQNLIKKIFNKANQNTQSLWSKVTTNSTR